MTIELLDFVVSFCVKHLKSANKNKQRIKPLKKARPILRVLGSPSMKPEDTGLFIQAQEWDEMSHAAFGGYEGISDVNLALRKPVMEQKKQELYLRTSKTI